MACSCSRIHTDAYESVRKERRVRGRNGVHVNHLIYRPGPHGKKKIDLIKESMIAGAVEDHQENQRDRDSGSNLLKLSDWM